MDSPSSSSPSPSSQGAGVVDGYVQEPGSCHCGRVQFTVSLPHDFLHTVELVDCNCTVCTKKGYVHLIVPKSRFTLLHKDDSLRTYTFNTHVAKHHFCGECGCAPFYIPRSNPDGVDVNVRCMDRCREMLSTMRILEFDGQNWEESMAADDCKLKYMDKQ